MGKTKRKNVFVNPNHLSKGAWIEKEIRDEYYWEFQRAARYIWPERNKFERIYYSPDQIEKMREDFDKENELSKREYKDRFFGALKMMKSRYFTDPFSGGDVPKHVVDDIRQNYPDFYIWKPKYAPTYYLVEKETFTYKEFYDKSYEEYSRKWSVMSRDNKIFKSSGNKYFKYLCKKDVRNKNKSSIHKIMKDEENWYGADFPDNKDGKTFIWDVW